MVGEIVKFPVRKSGSDDALGFYTSLEAARIARVPVHRVYAWKREGIVLPTVEEIDSEYPERVGYTFDAVVYLRVVRMLRDKGVSLPKAVQVVKHLYERFGAPGPDWENARVFKFNREIVVNAKDEWESTLATKGGQKVGELLLGEEFALLRERADALLVPDQYQRFIEIRPETRSGLPVIKDTTIQTATIYKLRERNLSLAKIREHYPHLQTDQIKAAISYERLLSAEAA